MIHIKLFELLVMKLLDLIEDEKFITPYSGSRIATLNFKHPYLKCSDCELIVLAIMYLVIKYAYRTQSDYAKFTLGYVMGIHKGKINFTIGTAITFRDNGINLSVQSIIECYVKKKAEDYNNEPLYGVFLRIYLSEDNNTDEKLLEINNEEIIRKLLECSNNKGTLENITRIITHKPRGGGYSKFMTKIHNNENAEMQPFIVADLETILIDNVHVPYAAGFLVVDADMNITPETAYYIETYFSENIPSSVFKTIRERSAKMLFDFIERIVSVVNRNKNKSLNKVYFHNLSRFDGILLLKYLASYNELYTFRPLMRNNRLYELIIYKNKKVIFRLRDSLFMLTGSLENLANCLCPHLGGKFKIQHDEVTEESLRVQREDLLEYMKQDILLLGGVMQKAQKIYWDEYKIDIVSKLTLSSLSLTIFRKHYYDSVNWPIYIPNRNQDYFIRRGYYGGHADAYIPYGENLHFYDVNSLYPYIMAKYPMPGGQPVWKSGLENQDLDNLFGFIEAYIECPHNIKRPLLPYRDENKKTLIFPTGEFVGVYYSEELKYARDIGYKITPLSGYMFENNNSSPFVGFVNDVFDKRQKAKSAGNDAMAYIYKIVMNSLYGRFGINPECSYTEVCSRERYDSLLKKTDYTFADKLNENYYIVSYRVNTENYPDTDWMPPRISSVQLAAAITACARIHMYKYISREDCYYTDTDSVALGNPLPKEEISSTELGKLKLEYSVKKGYFLAPKSYSLLTTNDNQIIKYKGVGKTLVDAEWFETQYADITKKEQIQVIKNFNIDWPTMEIRKRETVYNLGIKINNKRNFIYDDNKIWVDTEPLNVKNLADKGIKIYEYKNSLLNKENELLQHENESLKNEIKHLLIYINENGE